jgi:hypothetical protein
MRIHLIDKGTPMTIEIQTCHGETLAEFKCAFFEPNGHVRLAVESEALYDYCLSPPPDSKMYITFYREQQKYSFEGKLVNAEVRQAKKLVNIIMLSQIKVESRRGVKRFEIYIKVNVFSYANGHRGELLGEGETNDVSLDALSFSSNLDLVKSDDKRYALEFTLFNKHLFFIPVKLLAKKDASVVSKSDFDYIVLFDFTDYPNEKRRITNAFFNELSR